MQAQQPPSGVLPRRQQPPPASESSPPLADEPYSAITRQIRVTVQPVYLDDQSQPSEDHYVWAYHVMIENQGGETVQLRNRHWQITDARGRLKDVRGPGVWWGLAIGLLASGTLLLLRFQHISRRHLPIVT